MAEETTVAEIPSFAQAAAQINEAATRGEAAPAPKIASTPSTPTKAAEPSTPETTTENPAEQAKEESAISKLVGKKEKSKPAEEAKTAEEKAIDWKTAPKEFRERHEKLLNEHKTVAQKAQEADKRIAEYEAKIKEIESKTGDTSKADLKLVEDYTKKIEAYEATLRELDYSRSQEYTSLRDDYQGKYSQRYIKAVNEIKDLPLITGKDENTGMEVTRPATEADIKALIGKSVAEQRRLTRQLFGPDADLVNSHLDRLRDIQEEANFTLSKKLEDAKLNGEKRTQEQRLAQQKEQQEYQGYVDKFTKELESEWPDLFTEPKDDPEGAEALKAGKEFVEIAISKAPAMTVQDRAAHNVVLRARASAYPLLEHRNAKLSAQVESLTKELAGLRGSDPGNGGAKPAPAAKTEAVLDFKSAAAMFDNAVD